MISTPRCTCGRESHRLPFDRRPWDRHAVFDLQGILEDRVPPVGVFEPVSGLGHAEELHAELGPEVAGYPKTLRGGHTAPAQPAGYAADLHGVEHDEIGGMCLKRVAEIF